MNCPAQSNINSKSRISYRETKRLSSKFSLATSRTLPPAQTRPAAVSPSPIWEQLYGTGDGGGDKSSARAGVGATVGVGARVGGCTGGLIVTFREGKKSRGDSNFSAISSTAGTEPEIMLSTIESFRDFAKRRCAAILAR